MLWSYNKQGTGFTLHELEERFGISKGKKLWIHQTFFLWSGNDKPLIEQFTTRGETKYYLLTDRGISLAVEYLALQHTRRNGWIQFSISIIALLVAMRTLGITNESVQITQDSLELTAPVVLDIIKGDEMQDIDRVEEVRGMIPATSSVAYLQFINSSISAINIVDIDMTLWAIDRAEGDSNFRVCPMGYVERNDMNFGVSNIRVSNWLNINSFSLKKGETYSFTFDYSNLEFVDFWGRPLGNNAARFVKIDVIYKKKVGNTKNRYTKIFRIYNSNRLIDVEIAPDFGSIFYTKKISSNTGSNDLPYTFLPFLSENFSEDFKDLPEPNNMSYGECLIYNVDKIERSIIY